MNKRRYNVKTEKNSETISEILTIPEVTEVNGN